ncbi:MAG: ImmA/IrrE family metallo-endopeptidase [Thermoanaerobaculia bacterium]
MTKPATPRWSELLIEAVERPGLILEAYWRFHGYSLGNQVAAFCQCLGRGLTPGPIATVHRWNELGRRVKRGERALSLCMPVTVKERSNGEAESEAATAVAPTTRTIFLWKPRWFVLAQTEGESMPTETEIPAWDKARALETLGVREVPFTHTDGNVQGYARERTIAINPVAQLPAKTLFHELGHAVLHNDEEAVSDRLDLPKSLREAEADGVALLCCEALEIPAAAYCRGYIQAWYGQGTPIPDISAQRIFRAADKILRAGRPKLSVPIAAGVAA